MALQIGTFSNANGGNTLYKALTHPLAARAARRLLKTLAGSAPVAIFDPDGAAAGLDAVFGLSSVDIAGVYVQQIPRIGTGLLGHMARPLTDLGNSAARAVLVAAFDAERWIARLQPMRPPRAEIFTLDAMRIPDERLTNRRWYLDPLNFTTNFAFFRDACGLRTRLSTFNYWAGYGAGPITWWLSLFAGNGERLADWCESYAPAGAIILDSREIRARFGLPEFVGQLFVHVVGAAGHDVVKYALDILGDDKVSSSGISATHDANAWPADRYAGLPAPAPGEQVLLWVQNSHPTPIPAGAVALNPMGESGSVPIPESIAPFASRAIDVAQVLPGLVWPRQIELHAGKHMVRPRYEVIEQGRRRIAHVNVERDDLEHDPNLPRLDEYLGKGYLLPAPILPPSKWRTVVLPTPMATAQSELPIAAVAYDSEGTEIARHRLGRLPRAQVSALDLDELAGLAALCDGYGHIELIYDFSAGGEGDGWLHAIFRYSRRTTGHAAETSFGAHVFNTVLTYRDEPQSYSGRPPGLSTRLYLRLGDDSRDTLCQLIYPASRPWRPTSATEIILFDRAGCETACAHLAIPCSGSRLWRYRDLFDAKTRARAGAGAYAIVRDTTCRLFGYHALLDDDGAFSLDHMFGF
jgi:hypothetical protein